MTDLEAMEQAAAERLENEGVGPDAGPGLAEDGAAGADGGEGRKGRTPNPCQCAHWTISIDGGEPEGTGCTGDLTTRDFVRGHDSKLKALFIKAGEHDWFTNVEVTRGEGGFATTMDWKTAANGFGFASQVQEAVEKRWAKLDAKAERARARQEAREQREAEKANVREVAEQAEMERVETGEPDEWEYAEPERGDN